MNAFDVIVPDMMPQRLAVSLTPIGQPRAATQQSEKWLQIGPVDAVVPVAFGRDGGFFSGKP
jgi:hypothetical protein